MLRLAILASAPNDCSWSLFGKGLFRTLLEPYKRQLDHVVDSRPWTTAGVCCWWRIVRVRRQRRSDLRQNDFGSKIVSWLSTKPMKIWAWRRLSGRTDTNFAHG